jgi:hypothetical protein
MASEICSSPRLLSLPLTSCVLPTPAPPTNMIGLRSSTIMSRKKRRLLVSAVGTKTCDMGLEPS